MGVEASEQTRQRAAGDADETRLLLAAQGGDRQAFARLVEAYWPRLFRWLFHLTRDRHLAEDLSQETLLKALANLHRFRAGTNFRAWLFRIGHNALANVHRASRQRAPLPDDLPARGQGPDEAACSREALTDLATAVEHLPKDFKAALLLRVEEGLSFREIAGVLGLTEETARWRVFKARQKLMESVEPEKGS
ncbi:MAG: RNA polymerase sigma factor [Gemmataceae bacterium]